MTKICLGASLAVTLLALQGAAARAQVPATIAAPDTAAVATFHAEGAQLYECKKGSDGTLAWSFREPIATLMLDGRTVGRHFAGPTWEHVDGSAVTAKAVGHAPAATANDVDWLRLDVVANRGSGVLTAVATVQRINTSGGALHGACDKAGSFRSVPYSADYVFLRKAN